MTRITKSNARDDVSIGERDFTRDTNHPALAGKQLNPVVLEKPEGNFGTPAVPVDGFCVRVGAMRCHSQALILSTHDHIDARKDGFHLPLWDFSSSLGQLPFIDGYDL